VISILLFFVAIGTFLDLSVSMHKRFSASDDDDSSKKEEKFTKIQQLEMENVHSKNKPAATNSSRSSGKKTLPVEKNMIYKIFVSFSAYTNTAKLFRISKSSGQLDCLNGIRVLSITWVVLGHHFLLSPSIAGK
jgi:hypothetical protein